MGNRVTRRMKMNRYRKWRELKSLTDTKEEYIGRLCVIIDWAPVGLSKGKVVKVSRINGIEVFATDSTGKEFFFICFHLAFLPNN